MTDKEHTQTILELQTRWDKIRIANLYDALDAMGYPNQCLDLRIRPLFERRHLAGKAVTVQGGRDPRTIEEREAAGEHDDYTVSIREHLFPGAVVVVETAGEFHTGKYGEMTSWNLQQSGAKGIVLDSYIRDRLGLEIIPDFTPCAIGTSPVESSRRWYPKALNVPISLPGTLTTHVRINPGDWIVGGADGVIVVPQGIAEEALPEAEDIEARETGMRNDLAAGVPFDKAFEKWGRA